MLDPTGISEIAGVALGAVQTGISLFEKAAAKKRQNKLFNQRTTYMTPEEAYKVLQATQNKAQSGLDPATLQYLTGQTDQAFSSTLGIIERMGGDANAAAAAFDQKLTSDMKIGIENHAANMENFSKYLGALSSIGESKTAEWISKDNKLRDQLQAAGAQFQNANTGLNSDLNTIIAAGSALAQSQLYKDPKQKAAAASLGYAPGTVVNAPTAADRMINAGGISPLPTYNLP